MDRISVVIALYNPGKYFRRCLDSIVGQTWKDLEIILVNDGSTDGSLAVCQEYAAKDDRIVVISQENAGVSRARNRGIEVATGDYYSFIDSDDYLELDTYEYLLSLMHKYDCDAVNFEHYITYPSHEERHILADKNYGLKDPDQTMYQLIYNVRFACNKLFSKRLVEDLRFHEGIARGEDGLFAEKALQKARRVWFDKRALLHYVQTEESACRGEFRRSQLTALKLYDEEYENLKKNFPQYAPRWLMDMGELLIMLYCDMEYDREDYTEEQRMVCKTFKQYYKEAMQCKDSTKKGRVKMRVFRYSPKGFAMLHRIVVRYYENRVRKSAESFQ